MGHIRNVAVKAVTGQLVNMLVNDILNNNGLEGFKGWCADGEVFEDLHGEYFKEAMRLVEEIAPIVDTLTYNHLNYGLKNGI